jgi:hypothetical protein
MIDVGLWRPPEVPVVTTNTSAEWWLGRNANGIAKAASRLAPDAEATGDLAQAARTTVAAQWNHIVETARDVDRYAWKIAWNAMRSERRRRALRPLDLLDGEPRASYRSQANDHGVPDSPPRIDQICRDEVFAHRHQRLRAVDLGRYTAASCLVAGPQLWYETEQETADRIGMTLTTYRRRKAAVEPAYAPFTPWTRRGHLVDE